MKMSITQGKNEEGITQALSAMGLPFNTKGKLIKFDSARMTEDSFFSVLEVTFEKEGLPFYRIGKTRKYAGYNTQPMVIDFDTGTIQL